MDSSVFLLKSNKCNIGYAENMRILLFILCYNRYTAEAGVKNV